MPPEIKPEEITVTQLVYILFGLPWIDEDHGVIGRLESRMDRLGRLGWAIFFALLTAILALMANLVILVLTMHPHL